MKHFFEEYSAVIVVIVAIVALLFLSIGLKEPSLEGTETFISTFNTERQKTKDVDTSSCTITYHLNDGTSSIKTQIFVPAINKDGVQLLGESDIKRDYYALTGWSTSKDGSGTNYYPGEDYYEASDIDLYAQWEEATYVVVYDGNGATEGSMNPSTLRANTKTPLSDNAYKKIHKVTFDYNGGKVGSSTSSTQNCEYAFTTWNTKQNGKGKMYTNKQSVYHLSKLPNDTVVLYAQWKQKEFKYTGTKPTKADLTFVGWATQKDATVPEYGLSEELTISENTTLYAVWQEGAEETEYSITYHTNSGTLDGSQKTKYKQSDIDYTLPTPTRDGYEFKGWYTSATFSGTPVSKIASGSVGNKEFWAKWEEIVEPEPTKQYVTFKIYEPGTGVFGTEDEESTTLVSEYTSGQFFFVLRPADGYSLIKVLEDGQEFSSENYMVHGAFFMIENTKPGSTYSLVLEQQVTPIPENEATLLLGSDFNMTLQRLVDPDVESDPESAETIVLNDTITSILFDKNYVKPASGYVEIQSSGTPVYAWLDTDGETIKITSTADKIYANPDSSWMFAGFQLGKNIDVSWLNTSKVINMLSMFNCYGLGSSDFSSLEGVSNWDVSNVTNMQQMFASCGFARNPSDFSLDLSNWDTSNVTNMSDMFYHFHSNSNSFSLDLSNWDTSNVTDMYNMFNGCGAMASSFSLVGLSNWNTSSVINMYQMFNTCGYYANSFSLDLSNWDTSNVTDMSEMFVYCASDASSWTVKIPSKTGTLTNDKTHWYGSSSSAVATPASGKEFTIGGSGTCTIVSDPTDLTNLTVEFTKAPSFSANYSINGVLTKVDGSTATISQTNSLSLAVAGDKFLITGGSAVKNLTVINAFKNAGTIKDCQSSTYTISYNFNDGNYMPSKDDLIIIDGAPQGNVYRVLDVNGTVVELMTMFKAAEDQPINSSKVVTDFNGTEGLQYSNSTIDKYINETWYNSLSDELKHAIVKKQITQKMYTMISSEDEEIIINDPYDLLTNAELDGENTKDVLRFVSEIQVGERYAYLPSVYDLRRVYGNDVSLEQLKYFTDETGTKHDVSGLTEDAVAQSETKIGRLFRDAYTRYHLYEDGNPYRELCYYSNGRLSVALYEETWTGFNNYEENERKYNYLYDANAVINVDLSKIDFTYKSSSFLPSPTEYKTKELPVTLYSTPVRKLASFGGWYDNSQFSGSPITAIQQGTTGDKTYYAKWIGEIEVDDSTQTYVYKSGKSQGSAPQTRNGIGATVTLKYGTTAGTYNLNTAPKYTNAGTYTVYYKATAPGCNDKTGSYKIVINSNKLDGYVTTSGNLSDTIASGGSATVSITSNHGGTLSVSSENEDYGYAEIEGTTITVHHGGNTGSSAQTVTFTVTCAETDTYTAATTTFTATFAKTSSCVSGDTLVMMGDGTEKPIREVKLGDIVMTYNMNFGKFEPQVASIFWDEGDRISSKYLHLTFDNKTTIDVIWEHGFFDKTLDTYSYINYENYKDFIGHDFVTYAEKGYGLTKLIDAEVINEPIDQYSLETSYNDNFVTNGLLSMTQEPVKGRFEYFKFSDHVTWDNEDKIAKIKKYGLYTYDEWKDYIPDKEMFYAWNGPYFKILMEQGIITMDDIWYMLREVEEGTK